MYQKGNDTFYFLNIFMLSEVILSALLLWVCLLDGVLL